MTAGLVAGGDVRGTGRGVRRIDEIRGGDQARPSATRVVESVTHDVAAVDRRAGRIESMTTSLALMINIGLDVAILLALCGVMLAVYRAIRKPYADDGLSAVGGDGPSRSDLSGERRLRTDGPRRTNHVACNAFGPA